MPSPIVQAVEHALRQLPEESRRALTLRESEGLSYEAVAAVLRCPVETARLRVFQAREAIAQRLRSALSMSRTPEMCHP